VDFILRTIDSKIKRFEGTANAKVYYQVRVEYCFNLLLAYFWSKNWERIGIEDFILQGNISKEVQRPSIGSIANIIQKLDVDQEIKRSSSNSELTSFAELRNDLIGHGYSFEDDLANFSAQFNEWYKRLLDLRIPVLSRNTDLLICQGFDDVTKNFTGTLYGYDGDIRGNWKCPQEVQEFEVGNLYASFEPNVYIRLSPFIHIDSEDDAIYVYRGVQQPLIGQIRYNRIDRSGSTYTKCWSEFELAANDLLKRQSNGCIMNIFTPNYKRYIEVGSIKQKVYEFLTGKEKSSSVCITLWGHGGNGKTATVQKICEELSLTSSKYPAFDFIIFLTAKDRELNKYTGKIDTIKSENRVTTFDSLIEKLNYLLYSENSTSTKRLIRETSRVLLAIDDYETFDVEDQEKITQFIKELDLNYYKVIITTRNSFLKIGDEITTGELDVENTIKFLSEILANEHQYSALQIKDVENDIKRASLKREIHELTLGKPIEIIRFVNCFVQKGKLSSEFLRDMKRINTRSERIEFLYGRNYLQLQQDKLAQDIFVVIGLLTPQDTLSSLTSHIKLLLNKKEEDEASFNLALDKLVKLRLIDVDEDGSYKVDSKDILEIMKKEFENRPHLFKSAATAIYDRIKTHITSDTDRALLNHVKTLRHQSNAETAIQQYKEVLRKTDFSYDIRKEALLDLADFLFNHRGDKQGAVKLFDEYFKDYYEFGILKRYASYTWSLDKEKAIKILEEFNSKYSTKSISLQKNNKVHLLGLIVMREGQYWNDVFEREFAKRRQVKEQFERIQKNYGHLLISQLKGFADPKRELNSEEFNDISLALECLTDISYRLSNKQLGIEICDYVLKTFPDRFTKRFSSKRQKLFGYRATSRPSKPTERRDLSSAPKPKVKSVFLPIINLEERQDGYVGKILKINNDESNYGYISVESAEMIGKVYFRQSSLNSIDFSELLIGDNVEFGFGPVNSHKYGAINVRLVRALDKSNK